MWHYKKKFKWENIKRNTTIIFMPVAVTTLHGSEAGVVRHNKNSICRCEINISQGLYTYG